MSCINDKKYKSKKEATQKNVLHHSKAKLDFYKNYLRLYLKILSQTQYCDEIIIFDVCCGMGIYDNGEKGSAILSYDIAYKLVEEKDKQISFYFNDKQQKNIDRIKTYIDKKEKNQKIKVNYYSIDYVEMFEEILQVLKTKQNRYKTMIFIDPYGYKNINKNVIDRLMKGNKNEIVLFLPIAQMYRFSKAKEKTSEDDRLLCESLEDFLCSFFPNKEHPIRSGECKNQIEFIAHIKEAMRDENTYSCSYHIEAEKKQYYALFYLTKHIYGLEKAVEIKWKLDKDLGQGYNKKNRNLFSDLEIEEKKEQFFSNFKKNLSEFLKTYRNNNDIFKFSLTQEVKLSECGKILQEWYEKGRLDFISDKRKKKTTFYLGYNYYKEGQILYKVRYEENKN